MTTEYVSYRGPRLASLIGKLAGNATPGLIAQ